MNTRMVCLACGRIEDVAAPIRTFPGLTQTLTALCNECLTAGGSL